MTDVTTIDQRPKHHIRLDELGMLEDGWLNGTGKAPTAEALAAARNMLGQDTLSADVLSIMPTEAGGLILDGCWWGTRFGIKIDPTGNIYNFNF